MVANEYVFAGNVWTACNIAVYSFCLSSAGSYSYCQYRRSIERDGLRQVQAVASKKKAEHEAKRRKEQAAKLAEQRRLEEERKKTWSYWAEKNLKFWGSEK
jgi:cytochrome c oxidase assembly protein subunit 20